MATHFSLHALSIPLKISPCVEKRSCAYFLNKSLCLYVIIHHFSTLKSFWNPLFACKPALEGMLSIFKSCQRFLLIVFFRHQQRSVIMRFARSKGVHLYKQCGLPEHSVPYMAQKLPVRAQIKKTKETGLYNPCPKPPKPEYKCILSVSSHGYLYWSASDIEVTWPSFSRHICREAVSSKYQNLIHEKKNKTKQKPEIDPS